MRPGRGSRHCRHHYSRVPRKAPAPNRPLVWLLCCCGLRAMEARRGKTSTSIGALRLILLASTAPDINFNQHVTIP